MDADTINRNARLSAPAPDAQPPRLSGGTIALRVLLVIFGAVLGVVPDGILLVASAVFAFATWPAPCVGWQYDVTRGLDIVAAIVLYALLLLIPAATALAAVTIGSYRAPGRRLRQWAIAVGSITAVLLIAYVLTCVAIGYVYHGTPSHNACTYPFSD